MLFTNCDSYEIQTFLTDLYDPPMSIITVLNLFSINIIILMLIFLILI